MQGAPTLSTRERVAVRCLLGMLGVDVHNKGLRTLARMLRDQGVEVIYIGEHNSAEGMARAAAMEDVDVIGVSFSTSTYLGHVEALMEALRDIGSPNASVMVGGLIHRDDEAALRDLGVAGIFGPGSTKEQIMEFLVDVAKLHAPRLNDGEVGSCANE